MRHLILLSLLSVSASAFAQVPRTSVPATCVLDRTEALAAFSSFMKASPSKEEVSALLKKADEKIADFEKIVKTLRPNLEKASPGTVKQNIDAATNGHELISGLLPKGPDAQGLVGVLSILDDLSRSASRESVLLLIDGGVTPNVLTGVTALSSAGNALYDISELVFHTTFRAVGANEALISTLVDVMK